MAQELENTIAQKKEEDIRQMFDVISPRYDFLNRFFSLGIDGMWRRTSRKAVMRVKHDVIIDVATGTGELALEFSKHMPCSEICGLDLSPNMIAIARAKAAALKKGNHISFTTGSALQMPFTDKSADVVSIAFGIRNFESPEAGLSEIWRVLKPGGHLFILEFSKTDNKIISVIFGFYFSVLIPFIGNLLTGHKFAYTYLNRSAGTFPSGEHFALMLRKSKFEDIHLKKLSTGIATLYSAKKKEQ